jgi:uncharacterized cupredoxin-like copper-binding protein
MLRLLALALASASVAAPAQTVRGAEVVKVTLADYKFVPPTIHLPAGKAVILRLANAAEQPHEFAAPEFFRAAMVRAADMKFINKEGEAEVEAGKQVDILLVPKAGTYHLQCNKPGHNALGMHGSIVVK